jgi:hypothetical protein
MNIQELKNIQKALPYVTTVWVVGTNWYLHPQPNSKEVNLNTIEETIIKEVKPTKKK